MSAEGQLVDQFGRPVQMVATPSGWRIEVLGDPLPPEMRGPSIWVDPNGEGRPNGTFPVKHPNSGPTDKQKPTAPKAVKPIDNGTQGRVYTMPLPPPPPQESELADYAERSAQVLEGYVEGLVEPVVESAKLAVEGLKSIATEPIETAKALAWGAKELGGMALDGWRQIAGDPQQAVEAFVWAGKEALAKANEILAGDPKQAGRLIGEIAGTVAPLGTLKAGKLKARNKSGPSSADDGATIVSREAEKLSILIAQRRETAREFYRKQGIPEFKIDGHLAGVDFTKPVEVVVLEPGTLMAQYQVPGAPQGNYYSILSDGSTPTSLGISSQGVDRSTGLIVDKTLTTYEVVRPVEALRTTAAAIKDTWSVPGATVQTAGGSTQFFSAAKDVFVTKPR